MWARASPRDVDFTLAGELVDGVPLASIPSACEIKTFAAQFGMRGAALPAHTDRGKSIDLQRSDQQRGDTAEDDDASCATE